MPITGIKYRNYSGRMEVGTVEELLALGASDPWYPMPLPILQSMLEDNHTYDTTRTYISVTELLTKCMRCHILKDYVDYTVDLDYLKAAWRGSMYHYVLEEYQIPDTWVEYKFKTTLVNGIEMVGKPDLIWPKFGALVDLKTTQNVPRWDRPWDNHVEQLNMYRYMVNHCDGVKLPTMSNDDDWLQDDETLDTYRNFKFHTLGIWYVDDTGPKPLEVRKSFDVPTKPGALNPMKKVKRPDIWTNAAVGGMMATRAERLVSAKAEYVDTGRLPAFGPGIDPTPALFWPHRFSGPVDECLKQWYQGN